ncbi:MAG: histone deacetylase [Gemmatimonadetes bacterium]|nr:histone deacetylase [Gemmatimonadota bacterium]
MGRGSPERLSYPVRDARGGAEHGGDGGRGRDPAHEESVRRRLEADPVTGGPPTAFLLHPSSSLHDTGWGHPEHQGRLRALASTVGRDMLALHGSVEQVAPGDVDEAVLLSVHDPSQVEEVRRAVGRAAEKGAGVALDADTVVSAASWDAALGSVAASITAAGAVMDGRHRNAFVAARPPGHHATPSRAMGFCLFNTVAVAARWLQERGHAERVLIVDWDVHHGNGTQDVFWEDPDVFYLSLHQSPHYPGTGAAGERGAGAGEGSTLNVPLPGGTSRDTYLERYEAALDEAFERFTPDFVLVSSGFDCLAGDPLGGFLLEPEDLHAMTRSLVARADDACAGRVVACLEGGYAPERVGRATVDVVRALAGVEPWPGREFTP